MNVPKKSSWLAEFLVNGAALSKSAEEIWVGWGDGGWHALPPPNRLAFYAPDFFLQDSTPWFHPCHWSCVSAAELRAELRSWGVPLPSLDWHRSDRGDFERLFAAINADICAGVFTKAVPIVFDTANGNISGGQIAAIISTALSNAQGNPLNLYGCWTKDRGMLGATPEILFERHSSNTVRTMALAGTQSEQNERTLLLSEKDRWEHELVVSDISRALSHFGKTTVRPISVLKLPLLRHLYTPVEVELTSELSFIKLVRCLHPTAAMSGVPRDRALQCLAEVEKRMPRGRFGAPFGIVTEQGEVRCVVAIRGVQWALSKLRIGAGCGVVRKSEVHAEWNELDLKLAATKQVLGL